MSGSRPICAGHIVGLPACTSPLHLKPGIGTQGENTVMCQETQICVISPEKNTINLWLERLQYCNISSTKRDFGSKQIHKVYRSQMKKDQI